MTFRISHRFAFLLAFACLAATPLSAQTQAPFGPGLVAEVPDGYFPLGAPSGILSIVQATAASGGLNMVLRLHPEAPLWPEAEVQRRGEIEFTLRPMQDGSDPPYYEIRARRPAGAEWIFATGTRQASRVAAFSDVLEILASVRSAP